MTWREQAACRGADPHLFFPERGGDLRTARAVCDACPVREQCREAGMGEKFGVWGGLSERQRRAARRGRSLGKPRTAVCGTRAKYVAGCRCEACKDAQRRYDTERYEARRQAS